MTGVQTCALPIWAYSNSVTQAVENIGVVKRVLQQELNFHVAYNRFDKINHYLKENKIFINNTNYGIDIKISVFIDEDKQESFKKKLINLLAGKVDFTKGEERYNEIPVADHNYHEK